MSDLSHKTDHSLESFHPSYCRQSLLLSLGQVDLSISYQISWHRVQPSWEMIHSPNQKFNKKILKRKLSKTHWIEIEQLKPVVSTSASFQGFLLSYNNIYIAAFSVSFQSIWKPFRGQIISSINLLLGSIIVADKNSVLNQVSTISRAGKDAGKLHYWQYIPMRSLPFWLVKISFHLTNVEKGKLTSKYLEVHTLLLNIQLHLLGFHPLQ